MVEWWLSGAGSRRSCEPEAEATGLAPKQAADRHDPLALPSEGFVLVDSAAPPCRAGGRGASLRLGGSCVRGGDCFGEVSELRPCFDNATTAGRRLPGAPNEVLG